ncbi:MAG: bifunctional UDP-N-acetylmuramoyl-tripeptide:D-alanyl-D-alanine ligase/alanine racemase [Ekhidna sp.]
MLFSEMAKCVSGDLHLTEDGPVKRFSTDTRTLSGAEDEVFVAVSGKRDGHQFVGDAVALGVRHFILERPLDFPDINTIVVKDTIRAFQQIAKAHRDKFDLTVVAITGSNGKTTVKEWLFILLSEQYFVVKSPKSYNSQIGVPLSVLEINDHHEIGVFEAGISTTDEMQFLKEVIRPTIGIFTNLGQAHDDGFTSREEKLSEKLKLFENVDALICRTDTAYFDSVEKKFSSSIVSWSTSGKADYTITWSDHNIRVNDKIFATDFENETDLENVTHSIVAALHLGLEVSRIQKGLDMLKPIPMRLELKKGINGCYVLDDSYNNDLAGLRVALDHLESHRQNEKKTLVLSDILQSGKPSEQLYTEVASILKEKKINRLIGVGEELSKAAHLFDVESTFFPSTDAMLNEMPVFEDEMVVVKGARVFALERIAKILEERSHGTVLEVNFEALRHNLNAYRNLLSPSTKIMVMVKANAYGSGILEIANFLQHQRIDQLGVAYVDEAIQLRKNGINIPIMIMNPHIESFREFERYDLQAEIFSINYLKRLLHDTKKHPRIHLKIDSGMHRLGFNRQQIPELIQLLKANRQLKVEGIFTHFSSADTGQHDAYTTEQAQIFDEVYDELVEVLGYRPIKHACNSAGMTRWPQYHYDMVRLGIGLHGFDPTGTLKLRHTSELKTIISQIQELKMGDTVGYSRNGLLEKDSKIAILPIGYEDGYLRLFGNGKAVVGVNGHLCPTVGNVCMDMTMIDVTGLDVKEGDEVIIFGVKPSIKELADWSETIPYEILTNVSSRVKRVFVSQ